VEEQEAGPMRAPVRKGRYTPEQKQKILEALATWQGSVPAFCEKQGIPYATVHGWKNVARNAKAPAAKKPKTKVQRTFSPDDRRQTVEAFLKAGQTFPAFAKAWGVNERVLKRWVNLYEKKGPKALAGRLGRKPGRKKIAPALRESIKQVKATFPDFGLRKVQGFLARFQGLKPTHATITRVVKEEALPPGRSAPRRWKKTPVTRSFERANPGELWQTDITSFHLPRHSQRVYLVAFMDDCSRYVVAWKLGMQQTATFVQEAFLEGIQRFGQPKELLSDQGRQYHTWRGTSAFRKLLDRQGIKHVLSRPHHPQTVGKCERFWKTVGEEFWARAKPEDLQDAQRRLAHYINHYNHFRPHQSLDNAAPADRFFGAESTVRKALEAAWSENQERLAVEQPTRRPVFLVGQIGDQSISLHGERGKLVMHTSEGQHQELRTLDLGMAQANSESEEKNHGRDLDGTSAQREHGDAADGADPGEAGAAQGQAQRRLQDGDPTVPGAGHLGAGHGAGTSGSPQAGRADVGALAGPHDAQGIGGEAQPAGPEGLADEPTSAGRDGGGSYDPAQAAAEGDADGPRDEGGQRRAEDAAQGEPRAAGAEPGAPRALGSAEGPAGDASSAEAAGGEKNQAVQDPTQPHQHSQPPQAASEPGCDVPVAGGVTAAGLPSSLEELNGR